MKTWPGKESEGKSFHASQGWFHRFKAKANFYNVKIKAEATSADTVTPQEFPEMLPEIIDEGMYLPKQVFNVDETGTYWKKMPAWRFTSEEEKLIPDDAAAKDRLTPLFSGNVSSDLKLKLLLVYHSENPKALKNMAKDSPCVQQ